MTNVRLYPQTVIPYNDITLFKLTSNVEVPWVNPVSYWPPTKAEIKTITHVARSITEHPTILDIGCGNAFVSYLIAQEVSVIGIDPNEELLERTPYKHPNLQLIPGTAEDAVRLFRDRSIDVVLSSWMPQGIDLSDSIYELNTKAIIFVYDQWGFTGTKDSYKLMEGYNTIAKWCGITTTELGGYFDELCKRLDPFRTYGPAERYLSVNEATGHERWKKTFREDGGIIRIPLCNVVDVRLRTGVARPQFPITLNGTERYPWEGDLEHVLSNTYHLERYKLPLGPLNGIREYVDNPEPIPK